MKSKVVTTLFTFTLIAGFIAFSLSRGVASVSASARNGELHATKDCGPNQPDHNPYDGNAGSHCTIDVSNLAEMNGATVTYGQGAGIPAHMLDSNVVLDAGNGNRAVGRCTLDFLTATGLCTFSDGTGQFVGFSARVNVSHDASTGLWHWDGTYSFQSQPPR